MARTLLSMVRASLNEQLSFHTDKVCHHQAVSTSQVGVGWAAGKSTIMLVRSMWQANSWSINVERHHWPSGAIATHPKENLDPCLVQSKNDVIALVSAGVPLGRAYDSPSVGVFIKLLLNENAVSWSLTFLCLSRHSATSNASIIM